MYQLGNLHKFTQRYKLQPKRHLEIIEATKIYPLAEISRNWKPNSMIYL